MMKTRIFFLLGPLLLFTSSLWSQSIAPKYSNEFLSIGVGARGLAMSNSQIASVDDVTSGYWNPAGLLEVKSDMQLGVMHSEYFAGIAKYDYGAIAKPIDSSSALGVSLIRFGVDDIPNTIDLIDSEGNIDYDRITSFSAADYAALISYAKDLDMPGLKVGGNVKIIHRKVGDMAKAWGFGLDVGAHYRTDEWKLGAMVRDVTTTFNAWSYDLDDRTKEVFKLTGNEIPENSLELTMPKILLGAARNFRISEKFDLLAELDVDITTDGLRNVPLTSDPFSFDPHFGFELGYDGFIFFRGGIGNFQTVKGEMIQAPQGDQSAEYEKDLTFQPNLGVGVNIKDRLIVDYALTDIGDQSVALYSNVFSLKYNIFKLKD